MKWNDSPDNSDYHKSLYGQVITDYLKHFVPIVGTDGDDSNASPYYVSPRPSANLLECAVGTGSTDVTLASAVNPTLNDVALIIELKKPKSSTSSPRTSTSRAPSPTNSPRNLPDNAFVRENYGQVVGELLAANVPREDGAVVTNKRVPAILTNLVDVFAVFYLHYAQVKCVVFRGGSDAIRVGFAFVGSSVRPRSSVALSSSVNDRDVDAYSEFRNRADYSGKPLPQWISFAKCGEEDEPPLEFVTPVDTSEDVSTDASPVLQSVTNAGFKR